MRYFEIIAKPAHTRQRSINNFNYNYSFTPAIEVIENDDELSINIELPGMQKNDVKLVFERNILKITGEKKDQNDENKTNSVLINERVYGKFERNFRLNDNYDSNSISANFENGVLQIKINKVKSEKPVERIIEINQN